MGSFVLYMVENRARYEELNWFFSLVGDLRLEDFLILLRWSEFEEMLRKRMRLVHGLNYLGLWNAE